jgi:hypothetical protein
MLPFIRTASMQVFTVFFLTTVDAKAINLELLHNCKPLPIVWRAVTQGGLEPLTST